MAGVAGQTAGLGAGQTGGVERVVARVAGQAEKRRGGAADLAVGLAAR